MAQAGASHLSRSALSFCGQRLHRYIQYCRCYVVLLNVLRADLLDKREVRHNHPSLVMRFYWARLEQHWTRAIHLGRILSRDRALIVPSAVPKLFHIVSL